MATYIGTLMGVKVSKNKKQIYARIDIGQQLLDGKPEDTHASFFFEDAEDAKAFTLDYHVLRAARVVPKVKVTGVRLDIDKDEDGDRYISENGEVNVTLRQKGTARPTCRFVQAREKGVEYTRAAFVQRYADKQAAEAAEAETEDNNS